MEISDRHSDVQLKVPGTFLLGLLCLLVGVALKSDLLSGDEGGSHRR